MYGRRAQTTGLGTRNRSPTARGTLRPGTSIGNASVVSVEELNSTLNIGNEAAILAATRQRQRPSSARRKRMMQLMKPTVAKVEKDLTLLDRQRLEESQEVRAMRNVMKKAEAHHFRDQQLKEKAAKFQYEVEFDARMDEMMERGRQAQIREEIRKEELKKEASRARARAISEQLLDREMTRMRALDQQEAEKDEFLRHIEAQRVAEVEKQKAKQAVARRRKQELLEANKMAIQLKQMRKEQAQREEMDIVEYQRRKVWEEERQEAEKQRIKREKDKEAQRLLLAQEKASDRRGQEDEQRMLQAYQVKEKEYAVKVAKQKADRARQVRELKLGWEEQMRTKAVLFALEGEQERWEFENQKRSVALEQAKLDAMEEKKRAAALEAGRALEKQMAAKTIQRQRNRQTELDAEFGVVEMQQKEEQRKIEQIRQESMRTMRKKGYPEQYWKKLHNRSLGMARQIVPSDVSLF